VGGELIKSRAIGVLVQPATLLLPEYEAKLIGDAGPPETWQGESNNVTWRYTAGLPEENRHAEKRDAPVSG
jgi:hypothetical protein